MKKDNLARHAGRKGHGDETLSAPSGFGDDHLRAQLVKLPPEGMHLQLNSDPADLGGLGTGQRPAVCTAGQRQFGAPRLMRTCGEGRGAVKALSALSSIYISSIELSCL